MRDTPDQCAGTYLDWNNCAKKSSGHPVGENVLQIKCGGLSITELLWLYMLNQQTVEEILLLVCESTLFRMEEDLLMGFFQQHILTLLIRLKTKFSVK